MKNQNLRRVLIALIVCLSAIGALLLYIKIR